MTKLKKMIHLSNKKAMFLMMIQSFGLWTPRKQMKKGIPTVSLSRVLVLLKLLNYPPKAAAIPYRMAFTPAQRPVAMHAVSR